MLQKYLQELGVEPTGKGFEKLTYQHDDSRATALLEQVVKMQELLLGNRKFRDYKVLQKDKYANVVKDTISKIIKDSYGINNELILTDITAATMPLANASYSVIDNRGGELEINAIIDEWFKEAYDVISTSPQDFGLNVDEFPSSKDEFVKQVKLELAEYIKTGKVNSLLELMFTRDDMDFIKDRYNTLLKYFQGLAKDPITFDAKNMILKGADKDHVSVKYYFDFYELLVKNKLTPREVTAIILHEVGHSTTSILYNEFKVESNIKLLETVVMSDIDTLINEATLTLDDYPELKDLNGENALEKIILYVGDVNIATRSYIASNKQSETFADDFVTKQGYGLDLAQGLSIFGKDNTWLGHHMIGSLLTPTIISAFTIVSVVSGAGLATIALGAVASVASLYFTFAIQSEIELMLDETIPHETQANRVTYILSSLIEEVRASNLDKETEAKIIRQAKDLITFINETGIETALPNSLKIGAIFTGNYAIFLKDLHARVNELVNNKLHLIKE